MILCTVLIIRTMILCVIIVYCTVLLLLLLYCFVRTTTVRVGRPRLIQFVENKLRCKQNENGSSRGAHKIWTQSAALPLRATPVFNCSILDDATWWCDLTMRYSKRAQPPETPHWLQAPVKSWWCEMWPINRADWCLEHTGAHLSLQISTGCDTYITHLQQRSDAQRDAPRKGHDGTETWTGACRGLSPKRLHAFA